MNCCNTTKTDHEIFFSNERNKLHDTIKEINTILNNKKDNIIDKMPKPIQGMLVDLLAKVAVIKDKPSLCFFGDRLGSYDAVNMLINIIYCFSNIPARYEALRWLLNVYYDSVEKQLLDEDNFHISVPFNSVIDISAKDIKDLIEELKHILPTHIYNQFMVEQISPSHIEYIINFSVRIQLNLSATYKKHYETDLINSKHISRYCGHEDILHEYLNITDISANILGKYLTIADIKTLLAINNKISDSINQILSKHLNNKKIVNINFKELSPLALYAILKYSKQPNLSELLHQQLNSDKKKHFLSLINGWFKDVIEFERKNNCKYDYSCATYDCLSVVLNTAYLRNKYLFSADPKEKYKLSAGNKIYDLFGYLSLIIHGASYELMDDEKERYARNSIPAPTNICQYGDYSHFKKLAYIAYNSRLGLGYKMNMPIVISRIRESEITPMQQEALKLFTIEYGLQFEQTLKFLTHTWWDTEYETNHQNFLRYLPYIIESYFNIQGFLSYLILNNLFSLKELQDAVEDGKNLVLLKHYNLYQHLILVFFIQRKIPINKIISNKYFTRIDNLWKYQELAFKLDGWITANNIIDINDFTITSIITPIATSSEENQRYLRTYFMFEILIGPCKLLTKAAQEEYVDSTEESLRLPEDGYLHDN